MNFHKIIVSPKIAVKILLQCYAAHKLNIWSSDAKNAAENQKKTFFDVALVNDLEQNNLFLINWTLAIEKLLIEADLDVVDRGQLCG